MYYLFSGIKVEIRDLVVQIICRKSNFSVANQRHSNTNRSKMMNIRNSQLYIVCKYERPI